MKLAVIGGRDFNDTKLLNETLQPLIFVIDVLISGGAKGADKMAEGWANNHGIDTLIFPAEWNKYGKSAGFRRNEDIIKNADYVIAFWDGKSRGTKHSLSLCDKYNKPYRIIPYNN